MNCFRNRKHDKRGTNRFVLIPQVKDAQSIKLLLFEVLNLDFVMDDHDPKIIKNKKCLARLKTMLLL